MNKPARGRVRIAMVGKYVDLTESYKSLSEALHHSGAANDCEVEIFYLDSTEIESAGVERAVLEATGGSPADAFLIPGGFGDRGTEGKIQAVRYARENSIPFFGICLGLQMAVIEFARHRAGLTEATSAEFEESAQQAVIDIMESQRTVTEKGGSMRLGAYPCVLQPGTLAQSIYAADRISERHRHRFEVNNQFRQELIDAGITVAGLSPDGELVEIVELKDHPWFVGVQFHPEFKSTPRHPHPLFASFIAAALKHRTKRESS